ncbi:MAG: hypothetical protein FRX49_08790 [Trebouxia sp. A1-2]|nr:MAG: hypothetical protein FRX49_08790 [Trebouxia sp. A1-2]
MNPYWRISDPPYGGLQADQRGNARGVQGNAKGFHFAAIPPRRNAGGTPRWSPTVGEWTGAQHSAFVQSLPGSIAIT